MVRDTFDDSYISIYTISEMKILRVLDIFMFYFRDYIHTEHVLPRRTPYDTIISLYVLNPLRIDCSTLDNHIFGLLLTTVFRKILLLHWSSFGDSVLTRTPKFLEHQVTVSKLSPINVVFHYVYPVRPSPVFLKDSVYLLGFKIGLLLYYGHIFVSCINVFSQHRRTFYPPLIIILI